jgi:hypothetical protein
MYGLGIVIHVSNLIYMEEEIGCIAIVRQTLSQSINQAYSCGSG